jgi:hypothetical protein
MSSLVLKFSSVNRSALGFDSQESIEERPGGASSLNMLLKIGQRKKF